MCDTDAARHASDLILNGGPNGSPAPPRPMFYGAGGCSGGLLNIQQNVWVATRPTSAFLPAYLVLTQTYSNLIGGDILYPPNGRPNASGLAIEFPNLYPTASVKYAWTFQSPFSGEVGWMRDMCMGEQYEVERDLPNIEAWKPGSKECDVFMLQQCSGSGAENDAACACIVQSKAVGNIGPVQCLSRTCSSKGYKTKAMLAPCTLTECDQIRNVSGQAVLDVTGEVFCGGKIYNLGEGATPDDVPPELLTRTQPVDTKTHSQTLMIIIMVLIVICVISLCAVLYVRMTQSN